MAKIEWETGEMQLTGEGVECPGEWYMGGVARVDGQPVGFLIEVDGVQVMLPIGAHAMMRSWAMTAKTACPVCCGETAGAGPR